MKKILLTSASLLLLAQAPPVPIPNGGTGTSSLPTGALKGAGTGAIAQAACSDLSNGSSGCSTNTNNTNSQSGTTYTLQSSDCFGTIIFTNSSAITLTTLNSLSIGCYIQILQNGTGQVTVSNGTGATSHSAHSFTKTFGQYAILGLFVDANSGGTAADFIIFGDGA